MNDTPTLPEIAIRVDEVLELARFWLEQGDLERAMAWGSIALSVNDTPKGA